jgi:hypothetical protein
VFFLTAKAADTKFKAVLTALNILAQPLRLKKKLDLPINGISGSTLSVNSMKRMARIALLLHNHVTSDD